MRIEDKTPQTNDIKATGSKIFAAIGKFSVKFRWLVVLVWLVGTIAAVHSLPSLSSVTQSDNSSFLPASSPSQKAIDLASAIGKTGNAPTVPMVVATSNAAGFNTTDQQYIENLQASLSHTTGVSSVRNDGESSDGQAQEFRIIVASSVNTDPTPIIGNMRTTISKSAAPSDLQVHLAGQLANAVDNSKKSGSTDKQLQLGSVIFIILLLLIIFRAPLAPLVTLVPPVFVVTLSGPLIAEAAKHGLKVSSLAQLLLTVLILGAGTDYGLFLIFRVREEVQRGVAVKEAIVRALSHVGETITFSAATVVAALLSLLVATFELYSKLGVPLAIGITLMLLAGLTLLPALIAIFGRAVFWPAKKTKEETKFGFWGRVSSSVVRRPLPVLIAGLVIFSGLSLFVLRYHSAGFGGSTNAPTGTGSAAGEALLAKHFPDSSANPTGVIFALSESVWQNPAPLATLQSKLAASPEFNHVTGPLNLNGINLAPGQITTLYQTYGAPVGLSDPKAIAQLITAHGLTASPATIRELATYQILANLISKDGRTVEFAVSLTAGDPASTAAMNASPAIRARVQSIASGVHAVSNGVDGESTAFYDISNISSSDLKRIVPITVLVIGVLLAVLLRSLVAPVYLIISVALSYLASLGLSVLIFMEIGHATGLTFILPFLMFIFLLALGEDYNILVMTRIREEAHGLPLRKAVSRALTTTGTTVTSAGLVLAGTFSVMAVVGGSGGNTEVRDIGVGMALGILMDTFLVRTLLVPSIVVLLGRWNWWPTKHGSLAEVSVED